MKSTPLTPSSATAIPQLPAVAGCQGKSPSSSSGTRVNIVETAENGPGDAAAAATPLTRERTGQRQGAVTRGSRTQNRTRRLPIRRLPGQAGCP